MICNNINFGSKNRVKRLAKFCAYSGEVFTDNNPATFEHIIPKSKKGKTKIYNCLAVTQKYNNMRGNIDLLIWLKRYPYMILNIQKYLNNMRFLNINGKNYVEQVKNTLNKECRGQIVFKGNLKNKLDIII